jgi:spore coat protein A
MWYHDHARDVTAQHVWKGLAGFYIVHDDQEAALNLPSGNYDVPLMVMNRDFAADGTMPYTDGSGDTLLVNGVPQPYFQVSARKYRFRLLNASNDDFYNLSLSNGAALTQIGNEGGLFAAPVSRTAIPLAPAERADVVVDFSKVPVGTSIKLTSGSGWRAGGDVMRFDVTGTATDTSTVPTKLRTIAKLSTTGAVTRTFSLDKMRMNGMDMWAINGHGYDPSVVDANPKLGTTEVWTFDNHTGEDHPLHVHDINFQVLSINGQAPNAADANWKETVDVPSWGNVKVAARFDDYTGTYVFHCHRLEHEDHMMMSQFTVTP